MLTQQSIDGFVAHIASRGLAAETVRAYRNDLLAALTWLNDNGRSPASWADTENELASFLTSQRNEWSPKTTHRRLGTLRSWAKWAGAPVRLLADYSPPRVAPPTPHPISEGIDGVIAMIQSSRNPRHRALCALTGLMGLRVDEAVRAKPADFDLTNMVLRVVGKGGRTRYVPVSAGAWGHIAKAHQLATTNGTTITRLTNRGARAAITRHARNAGLSSHVKSHDMRATFATAAYDKTKDLRAVQELLGHADAKTTQIYTKVSEDALRAAAAVLS